MHLLEFEALTNLVEYCSRTCVEQAQAGLGRLLLCLGTLLSPVLLFCLLCASAPAFRCRL